MLFAVGLMLFISGAMMLDVQKESNEESVIHILGYLLLPFWLVIHAITHLRRQPVASLSILVGLVLIAYELVGSV